MRRKLEGKELVSGVGGVNVNMNNLGIAKRVVSSPGPTVSIPSPSVPSKSESEEFHAYAPRHVGSFGLVLTQQDVDSRQDTLFNEAGRIPSLLRNSFFNMAGGTEKTTRAGPDRKR